MAGSVIRCDSFGIRSKRFTASGAKVGNTFEWVAGTKTLRFYPDDVASGAEGVYFDAIKDMVTPGATKSTEVAWTQGQTIYFNTDAETFTSLASTNVRVGIANADATAAAATGRMEFVGTNLETAIG